MSQLATVLLLLVLFEGPVLAQEPMIYPSQGQTQHQMEKDRLDCYTWAKQESGFDPMQVPKAAERAGLEEEPDELERVPTRGPRMGTHAKSFVVDERVAWIISHTVFACQSFAADDSKDSQERLRETIAYLTQRVAEADVIFVRNSKEYTPAEAAKHITRKYEYFKEKVRSPEDFIRLAATKSVVSGKPYLVKMKDGRTIPCSEWLHGILREYRAPKN